jgi:hypothetical protein
VDWNNAEALDLPAEDLEKEPVEGAGFAELPPPAAKAKNYPAWQKAFATWLFQTQKIELFRSPSSGQVSRPAESERDFRVRLAQAAREQRDAMVEKLRTKYAPKLAQLEERKRRAEQKLEQEKAQKQSQVMESMLSVGTSILGAFLGRKKVSVTTLGRATTAARSINKIRKESGDVGVAEDNIEALNQAIADLEAQFQKETDALSAATDPQTEALEAVVVKPKKTNITVQLVALAWSPE